MELLHLTLKHSTKTFLLFLKSTQSTILGKTVKYLEINSGLLEFYKHLSGREDVELSNITRAEINSSHTGEYELLIEEEGKVAEKIDFKAVIE